MRHLISSASRLSRYCPSTVTPIRSLQTVLVSNLAALASESTYHQTLGTPQSSGPPQNSSPAPPVFSFHAATERWMDCVRLMVNLAASLAFFFQVSTSSCTLAGRSLSAP